jgi:tight adherence protein C
VLFAASLIPLETMIPVAVFIAFAAFSWWLLEFLSSRKSRTMERLDEIRTPRSKRNAGEALGAKKSDAMDKFLEKAQPLAKPLQPKSEAELGKLRAKLAAAGFRNESAGTTYLAAKFGGLMLGLLIGASSILPIYGTGNRALVSIMAVAGLLFYLPDIVVGFMGSSRQKAIFLGLPDALDLMVVCVEAGLGLDQAMRKTAEEMKGGHPIISDEFAVSNFQLQMGRPKHEVLHELGARTGVSDLRGLAAVLIQADKFGSSVAQALRVQSDSMRTRRRQMAEEKAAKTAVKLIFPLVLFIFPGIFVVLVGPAALQMARQMFPMMGN